jgi:hypothetical protein
MGLKSGLYITELVKRLFNKPVMKGKPDELLAATFDDLK